MRPGRSAALLATALAVAGCGTGAPAAPVPTGPPTSELRIGLQEYRLQLSAGALRPGPGTVTVTNSGSTGHDVRLRQGERVLGATRVLSPGEREVLTIDVGRTGPVTLDCTVIGHAEAGMTANLPVAG